MLTRTDNSALSSRDSRFNRGLSVMLVLACGFRKIGNKDTSSQKHENCLLVITVFSPRVKSRWWNFLNLEEDIPGSTSDRGSLLPRGTSVLRCTVCIAAPHPRVKHCRQQAPLHRNTTPPGITLHSVNEPTTTTHQHGAWKEASRMEVQLRSPISTNKSQTMSLLPAGQMYQRCILQLRTRP